MRRTWRSLLTVLTAACAAAVPTVAGVQPAGASGAPSAYTVTTGSTGSWSYPDDTPAAGYLDKDGTFYFQQSHSLYGANDPREWTFYSGTDFDSATPSPVSDAGTNRDTTALCNNSPTGVESTNAPAGSGYAQRNYCDLAGVWVDPDTGDWYGLVHNEFTPQPFADGLHYDAVDWAVSTDQGHNWTIEGHAITSPYSTRRGDDAAFPQQTYYYGDGDQRLYVDTASGYFYVYYGSRVVDKKGSWRAFYEHVARAPIAGKMATGTWQKWYDGHWTQPGVGGKESNLVPVASPGDTGYTPPAKEYSPDTPGTASQQVAAGTAPPTSPLFVMDITYDAYLGLYIGEPQAVDQSGNAPQQYYATDNLATQKWTLLGDSGSYHTASWYRWFVDSGNKTGSTIVGKNIRAYCSIACDSGSDAQYLNLSIDSATPAAPAFDPRRTYRITSGSRGALAQAPGSSTTFTLPATARARTGTWTFDSNGDGSYRIANAVTGKFLGVPGTPSGGRAWGSAPVVAPAPAGGLTAAQQWFVIPTTSPATGAATGGYRLVNRYSGLVIGMTAPGDREPETTPVRAWSDTTGSAVGGGRTAAEQTLAITAAGTRPATAGGKTVDDPDD